MPTALPTALPAALPTVIPSSLSLANPQARHLATQGVRLVTVAVAGPALVYCGLKHQGSLKAKALLSGLGIFLVYSNWALFRDAFQGSDDEHEEE